MMSENHRASELYMWAELHMPAGGYISCGYRCQGMTIVEPSLTDILMIQPQYQKIVRRIVAHLPTLM